MAYNGTLELRCK